jgi:hypothetical protein
MYSKGTGKFKRKYNNDVKDDQSRNNYNSL